MALNTTANWWHEGTVCGQFKLIVEQMEVQRPEENTTTGLRTFEQRRRQESIDAIC